MVISRIDKEAMQREVLASLAVSPAALDIRISADANVVTLNGAVPTVEAKFAAEEAIRRTKGVRAVANELAVWRTGISPGTELAQSIVTALSASGLDPEGRIVVGVQDGWVDLSGEVAEEVLGQTVVTLIRRLPGVKGVINELAPVLATAAADLSLAPVSAGVLRAHRNETVHAAD